MSLKKCDSCEEEKEDVKLVENPYIKEIYDETRMEHLCDECYSSSCDDI